MNYRKEKLKSITAARMVAISITVSLLSSCDGGGSSLLPGIGGGLPGCESKDAQLITKKALMDHLRYNEGSICFMEDRTGAEPDSVGRAGFRPDPLNHSMAECQVAPNGRRFIPVRDFTFELRDYLVESEERAQDGRSIKCSISASYILGSKEQPQFSGTGPVRRLEIRYFSKTESGEQRYEAAVRRLH